jgi:aryl-alcohol dehydrogenase-like predicted oxidoreductase
MCWSPLAGGWLSGGFATRGGAPDDAARRHRAARMPDRFDMTTAGNRAKLAVVLALSELAAEAGTSLPRLAIAFVLRHPAVMSAIIGLRTVEQLTGLLAAPALTLSDDVLDRIDAIVPPGTTVNPADDDHLRPTGLRDVRSRRR